MPRRVHRCEARGCGRLLPIAQIMCNTHWAMVPPSLRDLLLRLQRKGPPSKQYVDVLVRARDAIDNC